MFDYLKYIFALAREKREMMNDLSEEEEEDSNRDDSINTPRLLVEVQL